MKKGIISGIIIVVILVITFVYLGLSNRIVTTITLDINPSIEIGLNKEEKAEKEKVCPDGYKKLETGRCIDETKVADKVDGYRCQDDRTRLQKDTCILFEAFEAKSN